MQTKQYLSDSVYVNFDGGVLELTTENGHPSDPSNLIILEFEVYEALVKYVDDLKQRMESRDEPQS